MTPPRPLCTLLAAAGLASTLPARAQAPAAKTPAPAAARSIFSRVIKNPTGKNGYEELVLAGETLQSSKLYLELEARDTTLIEKRRLLADRAIQRAVLLLRQGLAKPVMSPRETLSVSTELPELSTFRSLARLLRIQQFVFLADGRTADAVANSRLCLKLGRVVQTDTIIGGLVGIAIEAICIKSLGDHLDQLSTRDCEALFRVCLERLQEPDPMPQFLASERQSTLQYVTDSAAKLKQGDIAPLKEIGLEKADLQAAGDFLKQRTPEEIDALAQQSQVALNNQYDRLLQEWKKPAWQRDPDVLNPPVSANGPDFLVHALLPAMNRVNDRYSQEDALIRLLAVHCAIIRYRWENEKLPPTLDALQLGELVMDPFTGQKLSYEPQGLHYRLSSVGPTAEANDEKAVSGRRRVSIVRDDF